MTATLFLGFLAITVVAIVALIARYLPRRTTFGVLVGLEVWLLYVGLLGYFGVVRNAALPLPGAAFIFLPVFLFVFLFLARSSAGASVALAFPLWVVLGTQSFRVCVESFLHQLWIDGLVPRMLTYEGGNADILVGATAPLVAWLSAKGRLSIKLAFIWNVLGLLSLANVAFRALMTAPGKLNFIHAEIPNVAIATFPFTYIAGFFAPLALVLHVLAIRALRSNKHPEDRAMTPLGVEAPSPDDYT